MSKSELVKAIDINSATELKRLTVGNQLHLKKIARKVILNGYTYEDAGEEFGLSKHAVYEFLKRLYKKKHGEEYGKKKDNALDT